MMMAVSKIPGGISEDYRLLPLCLSCTSIAQKNWSVLTP